MAHGTPEDQQIQQAPPQDFTQKFEALYSQCKSRFDRQKQDLDNLEAHQHNINQAQLRSIATVRAYLQLTQSDVIFLRRSIRTQNERIDELRTMIDKSKQLSRTQTETITHLKQERAFLIASQTSLQQRAEKLEADLAAMALRVETLDQQLSRLKRMVREHKEATSHNDYNNTTTATATEKAEQDRRAQEIQRILSTIHGYEAVHTYALELLPSPSFDPSRDQGQNMEQETTTLTSPLLLSPQPQPTTYSIADTLQDKSSLPPSTSTTPTSSSLTPRLPFTTFNPANPFLLTISQSSPPTPPPSISATATITTSAATNSPPKEALPPVPDTEIPPLELLHPQQPSPPPLSPEKLLRLRRTHQQIEDYKAWMEQQIEQNQLLFQQFLHQERPQTLSCPFMTCPQYTHALIGFALSLFISFLAYITIQMYSFLLQSNQPQTQKQADLAAVCDTTYNTHSMPLVAIERMAFIPT